MSAWPSEPVPPSEAAVRRRRGVPALVALASAAAFALPSAAPAAVAALLSPQEPVGHSASTVEVLYLGNEGVLISDGGRRVAIDALFGSGLADYQTVPETERTALESAQRIYGEIDLVLATHGHADHFDAAAVARHLAANPDALFVSTPFAVSAVTNLPDGAALAPRTRALLPAEGSTHETIAWRGVRVSVHQLHHGRELAKPVESLGFLVEIGGRRILHLGDTEATGDELAAALGRERGRIDLLLVPYWRLLSADGRAELQRVLEPRKTAAFHVPATGAHADLFGRAGSFAALRLELAKAWPGLVVLDASGTRVEIGG